MLVVGLTGGIGAGKSTVAKRFAALGAAIIDVDALGREVLEPHNQIAQEVVAAFGAKILDDNGHINRAKLAAEVFAQPDNLKTLEAISHPAINAELEKRLQTLAECEHVEVVILDMAVLAESSLGQLSTGKVYSQVVVVETSYDLRIARLLQRGLSEQEAKNRMAKQASDSQRRLLADYMIFNDGTVADLEAEVDRVWQQLTQS